MVDRSLVIYLLESPVSSLYKRATPMQKRMLKIVEGAVINSHHAHPVGDVGIEIFARGVAKRAVGTLCSQLEQVLAERSLPQSPKVG